jgi:hypothetical protein
MREIIESLRLEYKVGLSHDCIARASGLSKGVVGKYVILAQAQGVPGRYQRAWMRRVWKSGCPWPRHRLHALPKWTTSRQRSQRPTTVAL